MSEVRLGEGALDLERIVSILRAVNPQIRFSLEMITRDPLVVRCHTDEYWRTFPKRRERYLPAMLSYVSENASAEPLPTVDHLTAAERAQLEEENIRACIEYARQKFG